MSRTRILFFDQSLSPGGACRVLFELLGAVDTSVAAALVVCRRDVGIDSILKKAGHPVETLGLPVVTFRHLPWNIPSLGLQVARTTRTLASLVMSQQVDVIHANGLIATLLAGPVAAKEGVPLVWHAHEVVDPGLRNEPFVRLASALSRSVICVSTTTRDALIRLGVAPRKCLVVRNAWFGASTEPATTTGDLPGSPSRPLVLAVGTVTPLKGHHVLLQATRAIVRKHPDVLIAVAGAPAHDADREYLAGLQRELERFGLRDNFLFLGRRSDVPALLARAAVVAHPNTEPETFGLVPLEAMVAGRAVIASRVGGLPEVVIDGETGMLVPPGDSAALAAAIGALLDDPELSARLGAAGRRIAFERFGRARFFSQMNEVFMPITGTRPWRQLDDLEPRKPEGARPT